MTFEDTIQVQVHEYPYGIAVVGNTAYLMDSQNNITAESVSDELIDKYDCNGDAIETETVYVDFSKCFISFNSNAQKIRLHDGTEYQYTYYVISPLKKSIYHLIPKEGQWVKIRKADGTIDCEMEVRGFVTYKKRFVKIWL